MKKLILLLTIPFLMASCSSDDDSQPTQPIAGIPMLTKATVKADDNTIKVYTITYDSKKRIDKISYAGASNRTFIFAYNLDDQISTISVTGDDPGLYSFAYDAFKRLKQYMLNLEGANITYDANTDMYAVSSLKFGFDQDNDVNRYGQGLFNFVANKNGPMHNAVADYHILGLFVSSDFYYIGAHKTMDNVALNGTIVSQSTNTFSENGYPTETIVSGLFSNNIKYEYTNM